MQLDSWSEAAIELMLHIHYQNGVRVCSFSGDSGAQPRENVKGTLLCEPGLDLRPSTNQSTGLNRSETLAWSLAVYLLRSDALKF